MYSLITKTVTSDETCFSLSIHSVETCACYIVIIVANNFQANVLVITSW